MSPFLRDREGVCHVRTCDADGVEQRKMQGPDEERPRMEWFCGRRLEELDDFIRSGGDARRIE